jgi:superfamily I DNA/RNA helicase
MLSFPIDPTVRNEGGAANEIHNPAPDLTFIGRPNAVVALVSSPDPERLAEEHRLFYVAVTRAKDRLLITYAAERGGRETGGPSQFLYEAGLLEPGVSSRAA